MILVWLVGGPSHLETYDPKPQAPSEFRGPFGAIPTRVPGMRICELLPRQAKIADKFTLLRSLAHDRVSHQGGHQRLLTGHPVRENTARTEVPDFLAIANSRRFDASRTIPNYVAVERIAFIGSSYLGPAYAPFTVRGDPNEPAFEVPNIGLTDQ